MNKRLTLDRAHEKPMRLGERLLLDGAVTPDQIQIALHEQRLGSERLGAVLVKLGFVSAQTLADTLAAMTGHGAIDLRNAALDPEIIRRLPRTVAERCHAVPVSFDGETLRLALADPHDIAAIDEVRRYFPRPIDIVPLVATAADIADVLEGFSATEGDFDAILGELEGLAADLTAGSDNEAASWQHPVIRLVNSILTDAVRAGASDIHLEPESTFVRMRLRIDGVLRQARALHLDHWPELSHRLKIMAEMDIADTRSMQDGRFHMQVGGAEIDFRMAIMPTVQGENIVIRILDHRRAVLPLEKLGYEPESLARLETILERPEGIVLVTGPTGCGKTTTLYAVLRRLSKVDINVMTLEEPVEYRFDMVRQTQIQEQQGLTFAEGVRGLLRQAPDIIFIGEIRDAETAQMAVRAAMTGHQVFSTLHSNDALGALPRLNDLGLSPRLLAENISGVVAQRLVRKLCPKCKKTRPAKPKECELLTVAGLAPAAAPQPHARRGGFSEMQTRIDAPPLLAEARGCDHCGQTGYRGRLAVTEVLRITPQLEELIARDEPRSALRTQAEADGFVDMAHDGLAKVLRHETSLDELRRAVDLTRLA